MTRISPAGLTVLLIDVQPLFLAGSAGDCAPLLERLDRLLRLVTLLELLGLIDRSAWPRGAAERIVEHPELFPDPEDLSCAREEDPA